MKYLAIALALAAAACGSDYDHTDISGVTTTLGGEVTQRHISVAEGTIVKAHIVVLDDDNEGMALSVRSAKPEVLDVAYIISPNDFAFIGKAVGRTEVQLIADDHRVVTIIADVVPQPTPP